VIKPDEVDGRRRQMLNRMAERAGLDPGRPIPVAKLREAMQRGRGQAGNNRGRGAPASGGGAARPASGGSSTPSSAGKKPPPSKVSGFGVQSNGASVRGFGKTAGDPSRSSSASAAKSTPATSAGNAEEEERYRRAAAGWMRRYDKNNNGKLEREEWKGMRGDPKATDKNGDGVITLDEMTVRVKEYSRNPSRWRRSGSGGSSTSSSSGSSSASDDQEKPKSYRFLSPTERLPDGLPEWFTDRDADADGQVAMVEWTTDWSHSKVSDFDAWDMNSDGMITPAECIRAEKLAEEEAEEGGDEGEGESEN